MMTTMVRATAATALMTAALAAAPLTAPLASDDSLADEGGLTKTQRQQVQSEIRDYILANPEIVVEALHIMQQRDRDAESARRTQTIASMTATLADSPLVPVAGNPDGDVTLYEFFDYNCGYCKAVVDRLANRIAADKNLKVVFLEFPILGETSVFAARVALAAQMQGRYEAFHFELMRSRGRLSQSAIRAAADKTGLDWARVERDMQSPEVGAAIKQNYDLADALGINGTPAFVIGNDLAPGAIDEQSMIRMINAARGG